MLKEAKTVLFHFILLLGKSRANSVKRNTNDQGSSSKSRIPAKTQKLRSDLLFYLNNALCFTAEEKSHGSLEAPFNENL